MKVKKVVLHTEKTQASSESDSEYDSSDEEVNILDTFLSIYHKSFSNLYLFTCIAARSLCERFIKTRFECCN